MVANVGQFQVVFFRGCHKPLHGHQFGYVHAGFHRHVQFHIAGAQAHLLVFGNGFAHIALTPVVGRQGQMPIAKHAVELLQVIQSGSGGCQHIAPVIPKGVLLQVKVLASAGNKLPHARCLGGGNGLGVEGAFNKGQQCQLRGHVAPLQLLHNVKHVFAGALGHAKQVVRLSGIPLLAVAHQIGV